jgi:hypothetical protein
LPLGWQFASSLLVLKLHANRFTGPLPPALSELTAVEVVRLDGNKLTGNLPMGCFEGGRRSPGSSGQLGSQLAPWHRLRELRLGGGNSLTGPLPPHLGEACPSLEVGGKPPPPPQTLPLHAATRTLFFPFVGCFGCTCFARAFA